VEFGTDFKLVLEFANFWVSRLPRRGQWTFQPVGRDVPNRLEGRFALPGGRRDPQIDEIKVDVKSSNNQQQDETIPGRPFNIVRVTVSGTNLIWFCFVLFPITASGPDRHHTMCVATLFLEVMLLGSGGRPERRGYTTKQTRKQTRTYVAWQPSFSLWAGLLPGFWTALSLS
jgi:hypothetical protein